MVKYRSHLPQLSRKIFITDGGLETTLVQSDKMLLPYFAAFPLLETMEGKKRLQRYYESYIRIAKEYHLGFVLESATRRANLYWGDKLGYSQQKIKDLNEQFIAFLEALRLMHENTETLIPISGCLGPKNGDDEVMELLDVEDALEFHTAQMEAFANTGVDFVTALSMNNIDEAFAIVQLANKFILPVVVSFSVEIDGHLPSGESLEYAVNFIDRHVNEKPIYYMINCAHPEHFVHLFKMQSGWTQRIRGVRTHACPNNVKEIREGENTGLSDPLDFAKHNIDLHKKIPWLNVFGGCCGTDHTHIEEMCSLWMKSRWLAAS